MRKPHKIDIGIYTKNGKTHVYFGQEEVRVRSVVFNSDSKGEPIVTVELPASDLSIIADVPISMDEF